MKTSFKISTIVLALLLLIGTASAVEFFVWKADATSGENLEDFLFVLYDYATQPDVFDGSLRHGMNVGLLEGYVTSDNGTTVTGEGTFFVKIDDEYRHAEWEGTFIRNSTCSGTFNFIDTNYADGTFGGDSTEAPATYFAPKPYLIIYADCFHSETAPGGALHEFAEWKRQKGCDVDMVKLSDIPYVTLNDKTSDVAHIRNYIRNVWFGPDNWGSRGYVLLVGDASGRDWDYTKDEMIQLNMGYEYASDSTIPSYNYGEYSDACSDYYYQRLGGSNNYAYVSLGRWSVRRNTNDLNVIVDKTKLYEFNPPSDWQTNRAVFACDMDRDPDPYQANYARAINTIRDTIFHLPAYDPVLPTYSIRMLYGYLGWDENPPSDEDVKDEINGDVGIVLYQGHGADTSWGTGSEGSQGWNWSDSPDNQFSTNEDIRTLTNPNRYPVVFQRGSNMGYFQATEDDGSEIESVPEAWTRYPGGGGVASLGTTSCSGTSSNEQFFNSLFHFLFYCNDDIGTSVNRAKKWTIDHYSSGTEEWIAYVYAWIGDPELDIWTFPPAISSSLDVDLVDNKLCVTVTTTPIVTPVVDAQVCVYQQGGSYHWVSYTDGAGVARFPVPTSPGTFYVTATKQRGESESVVIRPSQVEYTYPPVPGSSSVEETESFSWELEAILPTVGPNPVAVSYSVANAVPVELKVFDVSGREVNVLASGKHAPGQYQVTWDGCDEVGAECPAGVYFIRMQAEGFQVSEKITLIR